MKLRHLVSALALAAIAYAMTACAPGQLPPVSGTLITSQGTAHYDAKGGLVLTVDARSGK